MALPELVTVIPLPAIPLRIATDHDCRRNDPDPRATAGKPVNNSLIRIPR